MSAIRIGGHTLVPTDDPNGTAAVTLSTPSLPAGRYRLLEGPRMHKTSEPPVVVVADEMPEQAAPGDHQKARARGRYPEPGAPLTLRGWHFDGMWVSLFESLHGCPNPLGWSWTTRGGALFGLVYHGDIWVAAVAPLKR